MFTQWLRADASGRFGVEETLALAVTVTHEASSSTRAVRRGFNLTVQ